MTTPGRVPTPAEWVEQSQDFHTDTGHRISYRRSGEGPPIVLLHGFPTWSYDYAELATDLERDHDVITFDFLGYGFSDKPRRHDFTVDESADTVEQLLRHIGVERVSLVVHDYGGIVGQELLDRRRNQGLSFELERLVVLNSGIDYAQYRPARIQRLLILPLIGALLGRLVSKDRTRAGLDGVRGTEKLRDAEFDRLWVGMSHDDGHTLANRHIRYNKERAVHHRRWEGALREFDGPLRLVWGLADPVSGRHVLDSARTWLPRATIIELPDVGHFPQSEDPDAVAAAIRGVTP